MRFIDLADKRFGTLVVLRREGTQVGSTGAQKLTWACRCDCGREMIAQGGNLRSGKTNKCRECSVSTKRLKYLRQVVTYAGAHRRVRAAKGLSRQHACVDCGKRAQHWSYDNGDPMALTDTRTRCLYSLSPDHYVPRCAPCHRLCDNAVKEDRDMARVPMRTVRVPDPLWQAAQAVAAERGETVSEVIRRCLARYTKRD